MHRKVLLEFCFRILITFSFQLVSHLLSYSYFYVQELLNERLYQLHGEGLHPDDKLLSDVASSFIEGEIDGLFECHLLQAIAEEGRSIKKRKSRRRRRNHKKHRKNFKKDMVYGSDVEIEIVDG